MPQRTSPDNIERWPALADGRHQAPRAHERARQRVVLGFLVLRRSYFGDRGRCRGFRLRANIWLKPGFLTYTFFCLVELARLHRQRRGNFILESWKKHFFSECILGFLLFHTSKRFYRTRCRGLRARVGRQPELHGGLADVELDGHDEQPVVPRQGQGRPQGRMVFELCYHTTPIEPLIRTDPVIT